MNREDTKKRLTRLVEEATPLHGVAVAVGMSLPLVLGLITDRLDQATLAATGAFLLAFKAPGGPYGLRARRLTVTLLVIAIGGAIGGTLVGHPWLTVAVLAVVVTVAVAVPWMGPTAAYAVVLTSVRPPPAHPLENMLFLAGGGLWLAALLLVPWPLRRLRPLADALGAAADAIAELLDAVAGELDACARTDGDLAAATSRWERRRKRATTAVHHAATVYRLYQGEEEGPEDAQPRQLIDILRRTIEKTVGLHAEILTLAERGPAPVPADWRSDAGQAISAALAAQARLVSEALTAARPGAARAGPPVPDALAQRARAAWRAAQETPDDRANLLSAAIIERITRSINRIGSTLDSARRVLGDGLRLDTPSRRPKAGPRTGLLTHAKAGPRTKWLTHAKAGPPAGTLTHGPKAGPPAAWRAHGPKAGPRAGMLALGQAVRDRSPALGHAVRVALLVTVAMSISTALRLAHGQWMVMTVLVSLRDTYWQTLSRVEQRVGGTVAGSLIAAALLALAPAPPHVVVVMTVFAFLSFTFRTASYVLWMVCVTPLLMMLLDLTYTSDWAVALLRMGLILAGGVIAAAGARLLWPRGAGQQEPVRTAELLSASAALTRATVSVIDGQRARLPDDLLAALKTAIDGVEDLRNVLSAEPDSDPDRIERLLALAKAAAHIRDHLLATAALSARTLREDDLIAGVLERVADTIEGAAGPGDSAPDRLDLADELASLDDRLVRLTAHPEESVSGELSRLATIQHTLSDLVDDVNELITALSPAASR